MTHADDHRPDQARKQPRIGRDAGSRTTAGITWLVLIPTFVLVVWLQHGSTGPPAAPAVADAVAPPAPGPFVALSKGLVKLIRGFDEARPSALAQTADAARQLDELAVTEADQLRAAIAAGELLGAEAALERLARLEQRLSDDAPLRADVRALERLYRTGLDALDQADRERLIAHHGWFGRLALAYEAPQDSPTRRALVGGGVWLLVVLLTFALVALAALGVGAVLLVLGAMAWGRGAMRPSMPVPEPGGSVYLELTAVFVAGFLMLKVAAAEVAAGSGQTAAATFALVGQWVLVAALLWPMLRGVGWRSHARAIGWTRGRGVLREIGLGVVGYLACVPVYAAAVVAVLLVLALRSALAGAPIQPPSNRTIETVVEHAGSFRLVLMTLLAVVWAPLVEESVFRGALLRHLRSRWSRPVGVSLASAAFALMHGYEPVLLIPVWALGVMFGLLREWRGSLIAPMTAHLVHNAVLMALVIGVIRVAGA